MEWTNVFVEQARAFLARIGDFLPQVFLAILVLSAGWVLAKGTRFAAEKGLRAINFNVLTEKAGIDGFLRQGGIETDVTAILGLLVYWLVILAALMIACNGLGLTYVADLVGKVTLFVPNLMLAVLILTFGAYFARFVGGALTGYCRSIELADADLLGRLAAYATMAFVVLIALDQLRIGGDIIRQSFLIILGAVAFAFALAFGLAGQKRAADFLNRRWPGHDAEVKDPARTADS